MEGAGVKKDGAGLRKGGPRQGAGEVLHYVAMRRSQQSQVHAAEARELLSRTAETVQRSKERIAEADDLIARLWKLERDGRLPD